MPALKTLDAFLPAIKSSITPLRVNPKILLAGFIYVLIGALNANIIYDDGYLIEHYRLLSAQHSLGQTLKILFFILDLNGQEYRLYGVSKILHFMLWHLGAAHAWFYGAFMAAAQFVSALGIFKVLRRLQVDQIQSAAIAAVWLFSPFAVTSCFHHYSYLLLPYQLTVACALVLQHLDEVGVSAWKWRLLLGFTGFLLVTTGDSHLPAAAIILVLVACLTPADRPRRGRLIDLSIVFSVMAAILVFHRWKWSALSPHATHVRYVFAAPSWAAFIQLNKHFWGSLPPGVTSQIGPLFALAGPWVVVTALAVVLCALAINRLSWTPPAGSGLALVAALAVILVASLLTVWALSIFTSQVSPVLPRRYGYVPNTIAAMLLVAILSSPGVRRWFGRIPALAGVGCITWLWLTLVAVCLPIVRTQDAKVWAATSAAIRQNSGSASLLFTTSWNNFAQPSFVLHAGTPGLRGVDFPDIFESPFSYYWWESQYAVSVLGANFAAYRFEDRGSNVLLEGNGQNNKPPIVVPKQSVVVVADTKLEPSEFPRTRHRISVLSWAEFESSLSAHGGAVVTKGWSSFLEPLGPDEVQISLGHAVAGAPATLPDKAYTDPAVQSGPIANYGLETGAGGLFSLSLRSPLSYFLSNRNGSYTYRLDFTDQSPKTVALDLLDLWHETPGFRLMQVDAAFDDQWFHVDKRFDPEAFVSHAPLSIKLFPGTARTFRVRIASAPGATDIPFINGIRVAHLPH